MSRVCLQARANQHSLPNRYYTFLLDGAWRSSTADVGGWLDSWAVQRCGQKSELASQAWKLLGSTVYADAPAQTYEHHMAYCPTTMPFGSGWDKQVCQSLPSISLCLHVHTHNCYCRSLSLSLTHTHTNTHTHTHTLTHSCSHAHACTRMYSTL